MTRILSGDEVRSLLDLDAVLDVVADALQKQGRGDVERPARPHFPIGRGLDADRPDESLGTGLVMPAYIHGSQYVATKLVTVHPENKTRDHPTIHAQIAVTDAETGVPVAYMDGSHITAARTSAIGGLAARELTEGPISVAVIGGGTQARWQVRAIATAGNVESVTMFDHTDDTLADAVAELEDELDVPISAAESPEDAVSGASVVVTATTSVEPVFPGDALAPGTVVVAIGAYTAEMQELDAETFSRASRVFADVPEEVAEIGDILATDLDESALVPFSALLNGEVARESAADIVVVESVGSAVMDAAVAGHVFDRSKAENVGLDTRL
ncbi:ornithine cyclodeaminase family protein [Haladaptatus sp. GCM10025707]|uniref:ornithine cyclodeaminase family protein n=1 Tax=unclassified Haladaptatus TaxID=2622732 RepID=UPI0023E7C028|nr:ornithine cyclodeaminase family protein [Haladaptatus sp. QDMS2]